jgi:hypothetical protein
LIADRLATPKGKKSIVKKGIVFSVLFVLMSLSVAHAEISIRNVLNSPEECEGKTFVFEDTRLDREIVRNQHHGFYCLDVEIQGKHVSGHLYSRQLNFVVFSEELAKKLIANLEKRKMESQDLDFELMDHVYHKRASLVRLTCTIERFRDYWVAHVTRIEFYGNKGAVVETIE